MANGTWRERLLVQITRLETELKNFQSHFTNHLSSHKWDRLFNVIYFLAVIIMFCYLKWSK